MQRQLKYWHMKSTMRHIAGRSPVYKRSSWTNTTTQTRRKPQLSLALKQGRKKLVASVLLIFQICFFRSQRQKRQTLWRSLKTQLKRTFLRASTLTAAAPAKTRKVIRLGTRWSVRPKTITTLMSITRSTPTTRPGPWPKLTFKETASSSSSKSRTVLLRSWGLKSNPPSCKS